MPSAPENEAIVVLTTAGDEEQAGRIARHLVEGGLAACVNIVPGVRSVYSWKGEIADDAESLLVVKTLRRRFEEVRAAIRRVHPYDVPEVIALPVPAGDEEYLSWVRDCAGG